MSLKSTAGVLAFVGTAAAAAAAGGYIVHRIHDGTEKQLTIQNTCKQTPGTPCFIIASGNGTANSNTINTLNAPNLQALNQEGTDSTGKSQELAEKAAKEQVKQVASPQLTNLCSVYLNKIQEIYHPTTQTQRDQINNFCKAPQKYKSKSEFQLSDCQAPKGFDSAKAKSLQAFCSDILLSGSKHPSNYQWKISSISPRTQTIQKCTNYTDQLKKWVNPISQKQINLIYQFCLTPSVTAPTELINPQNQASQACRAGLVKHEVHQPSSDEFTSVVSFCTSVLEAGVYNAPKFTLQKVK